MVRVIVQFRDKYDETRVFYPGDLLEVEDEDRKNELLARGMVVEAVPKILKSVSEENKDGNSESETAEEVAEEVSEVEEVKEEETIEEIKQKLDEKGIKYDKRFGKEKLIKLLEEAE